MRQTTIPQQTVTEDIVSFEHQVDRFVRVLVGKGIVVEGKFQPLPSQTYESFTISDSPAQINSMTDEVIKEAQLDYQELMSAYPTWSPQKPAGVFRKEDLWHFVDLIRSRT